MKNCVGVVPDSVAISRPQSAKTSPSPESALGSLKKRVNNVTSAITRLINAPRSNCRESSIRRTARWTIAPWSTLITGETANMIPSVRSTVMPAGPDPIKPASAPPRQIARPIPGRGRLLRAGTR